MKEFTVLIAGRSSKGVEQLETALHGRQDIAVRSSHVTNGHVDPLHGVTPVPDLLLVDLSALWEDELRALAARPAKNRPIIIAVGPEGNTHMMRLAMQAGARDFFTHPVPGEELLATVSQVADEHAEQHEGGAGSSVTAVINAKGGAGASFLACNLAHILSVPLRQRVALIDLDLQFGTLPVYLDLKPRESLLDALAAHDHLDSVALDGYTTRHASGLRLLAAVTERLALPWEIPGEHIGRLIDVAAETYDHVIVDLPRQMDPVTAAVLTRADRILIVMQQELTHLRDAKRLTRILTEELSVPRNHLHVVVNRHEPGGGGVRAQDIREALEPESMAVIPSDYQRVSESVNLGVPIYDHARSAPITQALVEFARNLNGESRRQEEKSGLQGAVARFFGR
jgi:pilus assembly protein CpaE